jgi:hypothetical protein
MKVKKSKTKKTSDLAIREIVQEEMRKSLAREKHIMNSESIIEYNKYYKTAKQKLISDLLKPSFNRVIGDNLTKNIAWEVARALMRKL